MAKSDSAAFTGGKLSLKGDKKKKSKKKKSKSKYSVGEDSPDAKKAALSSNDDRIDEKLQINKTNSDEEE